MDTIETYEKKSINAQHKGWGLLFLKIVCLCVAAACALGVALDQVTTRICFEYFSEGFHKIMMEGSWIEKFLNRYPENCTVWGITWGILASWWVGAILGVLLGIVSIVGPWPRPSFRRCTMLVVACVLFTALAVSSLSAFGMSYYLETIDRREVVAMCSEYEFYIAANAEKLSEALEKIGRRYLLCGYIHELAYLVGGLDGICLVALVLGRRAYMRYMKQV